MVCKELNRAYIPAESKVIELGSGYCDFINNIHAIERYALDGYLDPNKYTAEGIKCFFQLITDAVDLPDDYFDTVFASNLLEHLHSNELDHFSALVRRILKPHGKLILIQPNFYYAYREYFHDFTHRLIFTHISLADYLKSKDFTIHTVRKKYLPYSLTSRVAAAVPLPLFRAALKLYMSLPFKPLGRQMLVIAEKSV
ncbi:MAG: class I SAM-dependent methyltransferase [Nitrospirae bacterium]|nr:class I SAM-dependent methyltransferase [Nitrospirota bacterium]